MKKLCKCGNERRDGQSYCLPCHALHSRNYRRGKILTPLERKKMNARSYTHVYVKRGKITKKDCEVCGDSNSQIHHYDYDKPLDIVWVCRPCHQIIHQPDSLTLK